MIDTSMYDIATVDEAIDAYIDRYGGYPAYLLMGADDEYIIDKVIVALETGREIKGEEGLVY